MRNTAIAASYPKFQKRYAQSVDPLVAQATSIPSPVWGWDAITPLADMPADHAIQMDNWIPRPGYCEVRRGSAAWATGLGTSSTPVESLMIYNGVSTATSKMFGAAGSVIYDASSTGAATSVVTGMSNARWQYVNFTNTAGGHYMLCANGADTPRLYDGTTWSAFSITGLTASTIIQVMAFHGRVWMIPDGSTKAWYLPLGAITGAATAFELGDLMTRGGQIMAMATWTIDTRQTVDDYAVFITSNGTVAQAIVYAGTDPASADTWTLIGVYEIGPPIGRRCFINVGGDLAIVCRDGIVPMAQMLSTDQSAINRVSITKNIMTEFLSSARLYGGLFGWEMTKYPGGMLAILNVPIAENLMAVQYVMNTLTGSWCRFTGLNANCWAVYENICFFGDNTGTVRQFDVGSSDSGTAITATMKTAFNYYGARNRLKQWTMIRPLLITDGAQVTAGIGFNVDFGSGAPITTPVAVSS